MKRANPTHASPTHFHQAASRLVLKMTKALDALKEILFCPEQRNHIYRYVFVPVRTSSPAYLARQRFSERK